MFKLLANFKFNSISFDLSSDMTTPVDRALWENIEIEYIKNLQQQVQFLELECNYLYPFHQLIFTKYFIFMCSTARSGHRFVNLN